ncbi:hypothetical protein QZH41_019733 [Actinostola sp. cb2023]|nr:hypothetical protein QZH41_019733 [Actinostola sp. cb2023]
MMKEVKISLTSDILPRNTASVMFPRQYLEYGGLGTGTPSMRERQYRQQKFEKAIDDVHVHKTSKYGSDETSIAQPEKKAIRKTMISGAIERMVEDLIQEAMSKGEFTNLPGSGKPIQGDPLKDPYMGE